MTTTMITQKNVHAALEAARKRRDEIELQNGEDANELVAVEQAKNEHQATVDDAQQIIRNRYDNHQLPFSVHPAAELFPMITGDEFSALVQDIKDNGLREYIVLWKGMLLDGRNRANACLSLGMNPFDYTSEIEDPDIDPFAYVISANLHRRHLSVGQRSSIAQRLANLKHGGNRKSLQEGNCSLEDAANLLCVSVDSVKRAKVVQDRGSDTLIHAFEQDQISVSLAARLVKAVPDKQEQSKIVAKGVEEVRSRAKTKPNEFDDAITPRKHDGEHMETLLFATNKADVSITQLKGIPVGNVHRKVALERVLNWILLQLNSLGVASRSFRAEDDERARRLAQAVASADGEEEITIIEGGVRVD